MARTKHIPTKDIKPTAKVIEDVVEKVQKETPVPILPKWQFLGGGSLQLRDGRMVDSTTSFFAEASLIPEPFMDLMRLIDPGNMDLKKKYSEDEILNVKLSKRKDNKFDVKAGAVVLNETPLTQAEANAFVASLTTE